MKLWLDDIRDPRLNGASDFLWAKTAEQAILALQTGEVTFASLDHDLSAEAAAGIAGENEKTGYDVVLLDGKRERVAGGRRGCAFFQPCWPSKNAIRYRPALSRCST